MENYNSNEQATSKEGEKDIERHHDKKRNEKRKLDVNVEGQDRLKTDQETKFKHRRTQNDRHSFLGKKNTTNSDHQVNNHSQLNSNVPSSSHSQHTGHFQRDSNTKTNSRTKSPSQFITRSNQSLLDNRTHPSNHTLSNSFTSVNRLPTTHTSVNTHNSAGNHGLLSKPVVSSNYYFSSEDKLSDSCLAMKLSSPANIPTSSVKSYLNLPSYIHNQPSTSYRTHGKANHIPDTQALSARNEARSNSIISSHRVLRDYSTSAGSLSLTNRQKSSNSDSRLSLEQGDHQRIIHALVQPAQLELLRSAVPSTSYADRTNLTSTVYGRENYQVLLAGYIFLLWK